MKTIKFSLSLAAASGAVWLAGCSTPETRIKDHPEVFAQLTQQEQTLIKSGQVGVGFGPEAVKLALGTIKFKTPIKMKDLCRPLRGLRELRLV